MYQKIKLNLLQKRLQYLHERECFLKIGNDVACETLNHEENKNLDLASKVNVMKNALALFH